jgi:DNA-binding response OmpR family regulator
MNVKQPQILIVEDEGLVAWELQEALTRMGYRVPHVVATGRDALASVVADCPDLIMMDIRLDGPLDGIETARRIKDICSVPVVYLTADCNDATLEKAKTTEAYGYILKPFEERALRASLEIALSRGRKDLEKKEAQEWNEIIIKNLEQGVIAADQEGAITRCNALALELLACSEKDLLGKPFTQVIKVVDARTRAPEAFALASMMIDNAAVIKSDCLLSVGESSSVPIEYRLAPLKNKNNNTIGTIFFMKRRFPAA